MAKRSTTRRTNTKQTKAFSGESWLDTRWRPMMAIIYMFICVLDYGVRPMLNYYELKNSRPEKIFALAKEFDDPAVQMVILNKSSEGELIPPILNEFVHIAFGAILGVAAWSRGREKIERIRSGESESGEVYDSYQEQQDTITIPPQPNQQVTITTPSSQQGIQADNPDG